MTLYYFKNFFFLNLPLGLDVELGHCRFAFRPQFRYTIIRIRIIITTN